METLYNLLNDHKYKELLGFAIAGVETVSDAVAAAAKLLQSCPTLCDSIDSNPPGFPVPGILHSP